MSAGPHLLVRFKRWMDTHLARARIAQISELIDCIEDGIDAQAAELGCQRRAGGRDAVGAAGQRAQPGFQFVQVEGLGQVVVGTELQTKNTVHILTTRRQHNDRRRIARGTQALADLQPVFARQVNVEDIQRIELTLKLPTWRMPQSVRMWTTMRT